MDEWKYITYNHCPIHKNYLIRTYIHWCRAFYSRNQETKKLLGRRKAEQLATLLPTLQDELLKPCAVRLPTLKLPQDLQSESSGGRGVRTECIYCAAVFKNRRSAYRHALDFHGDTVTFSCKTCLRFFSSDQEKKLHIKNVHFLNIFCHVCEKRVKSHLLLSHMSEKHFSNGSVKCCLCATCVYCNTRFSCNDSLVKTHIKVYHSDVAIKCNYSKCSKFFRSELEKQRHLKEVHENKPGTVLCVYCECKISKVNLTRHVLVFHHSQVIKCTFRTCRTYFKTEIERKKHEQQVHFKTKLRLPLNCSQCGKIICNRQQLKSHFRRIHQLKPIFCKMLNCREYFLSESELESHFQSKHADDEAKKQFKCNDCSYAARDKSNLQNHAQSNHRTGNFKCGTSEKMFNGKITLARHIATTHVEPKKCIHCGQTPRILQFHLRVSPCRKCKFVARCLGLGKLHKHQCRTIPYSL